MANYDGVYIIQMYDKCGRQSEVCSFMPNVWQMANTDNDYIRECSRSDM